MEKRTIPMQILNVGLSRTGTTSIKAALEELGYAPIYHGNDLFKRPQDQKLRREAIRAKYGDGKDRERWLTAEKWDQILGGFAGVSDIVCAAIAEELIMAYPEAKVILTVRDSSKWYKSFNACLINPFIPPRGAIVLALVQPIMMPSRPFLTLRLLLMNFFKARSAPAMRDAAIPAYYAYNERIREICKDQPERLLVYELGMGWGPLCKILGKDVKMVEGRDFPRLNDEKALLEKIEKGRRLWEGILLFLLILVTSVVVGVWRRLGQ